MSEVDRLEHLPPDMAVKADIVAWVGRLDSAIDELHRQLDRIPHLIESGDDDAAD